MPIRRPSRLALLTVAALALAACGGGGSDGDTQVSGVVPLPSSLALVAGEVQPLAAVVLPDPGAGQAVTWSSADLAVARVAEAGGAWSVRAVARGTTQLTVTSVQDPTRSAVVPVGVLAPPTLAFTVGSALLQPGDPLTVQTALRNGGDLAAAGVSLLVSYELGGADWLTVTPAAGATFDLAPGASQDVEVVADATGLASGVHVAVVEPLVGYGALFSGNPFSILLRVP